MKLYHEDFYRAILERDAEESVQARLLLGDGWRPLEEYVYDRRYVWAAGVGSWHDNFIAFVGRGGKYTTSSWWRPQMRDLPFAGYVSYWQPLPDGVDAFNPLAHWEAITGHPWLDPLLREPEPEYEPAPPTVRLIPSARDLLIAMRAGAVLRERGRDWSSFTLAKPGAAPAKVTARPLNPLLECVFIARNGTLPPRKDSWYEFDYGITDAGHAWLAANAGRAK